MQKLDQYLNVDAGTLNPGEHGETFVTEDGAETDLDIGHYERFVGRDLNWKSSIMTGRIYQTVIQRERSGEYLGKTVQVIPHVTDEIKRVIKDLSTEARADIHIAEIGGTVGDIEGLHFLEAIRQMRKDVGEENVLYVHVTYLPLLETSKEIKTKPTQNSVRDLRQIGIQPDIIACRSEHRIAKDVIRKIALFCDVEERAIVPLETASTIYEVPLRLESYHIGDYIESRLRLPHHTPELGGWQTLVQTIKAEKPVLPVAIVGKYMTMKDTYYSVVEAFKAASWHAGFEPRIVWIDSEGLEKGKNKRKLEQVAGIIVPQGWGGRGTRGKLIAIQYAREEKIPYLGLCFGMQHAVIEFARNVIGLKGANSTEVNPKTDYPVIHIMPNQEKYIRKQQYGGTIRLGAWPCRVKKGTILDRAYREATVDLARYTHDKKVSEKPLVVYERHRHRYEFNMAYREQIEAHGMIVSGTSPDGKLVEAIELSEEVHPFFVGTQYHPELKSRPLEPNPLFEAFVKAAGIGMQ
jgi:CTP synthase